MNYEFPPAVPEIPVSEFTAADLDGNMFRVFYDFGTTVDRPE